MCKLIHMRKRTRKPTTNGIEKQFTVRHQLLLTPAQYRKLSELANASKCSMGAVLRLLLDEAK